jgi:nucleotide-binding universal stress UspA family protein
VGQIVVGIDGSEGSLRGLRWALQEAALRRVEVEAVHTYSDAPLGIDPMMAAQVPAPEELRAAAESLLDGALAKVGGPGEVTVHRTVAVGGAASVLCERAAGADLLVVGARGLGGFRGLLLGSVSQQVVSHSPCPVVTVVPERS